MIDSTATPAMPRTNNVPKRPIPPPMPGGLHDQRSLFRAMVIGNDPNPARARRGRVKGAREGGASGAPSRRLDNHPGVGGRVAAVGLVFLAHGQADLQVAALGQLL